MRIALLFLILVAGCAAEPPPPPPPPTGFDEEFRGSAAPDTELRRRIVIRTEAYWAEIAAGRLDRAWQQTTWDYREKTGFEAWRATETVPGPRRIERIVWTRGANTWEGPELYALVQWRGAGRTGVVTWRQEPRGDFAIENTVTRP